MHMYFICMCVYMYTIYIYIYTHTYDRGRRLRPPHLRRPGPAPSRGPTGSCKGPWQRYNVYIYIYIYIHIYNTYIYIYIYSLLLLLLLLVFIVHIYIYIYYCYSQFERCDFFDSGADRKLRVHVDSLKADCRFLCASRETCGLPHLQGIFRLPR